MKKRFKAEAKRTDDADPQTKDEQEYLGEELFGILQGARAKEALLQIEEEEHKNDPKDSPSKMKFDDLDGMLEERGKDGANQ